MYKLPILSLWTKRDYICSQRTDILSRKHFFKRTKTRPCLILTGTKFTNNEQEGLEGDMIWGQELGNRGSIRKGI